MVDEMVQQTLLWLPINLTQTDLVAEAAMRSYLHQCSGFSNDTHTHTHHTHSHTPHTHMHRHTHTHTKP